MFESIAELNPLDGAPGVPLAGDTMRRRAILITFIVALAAIFPCRVAVGAGAAAEIPDLLPPLRGYELVWSDEFDGTELDMKKWGYRFLGVRHVALNTRGSVSLDGKGNLVLTTSRAPWRAGDKAGEYVDDKGNLILTVSTPRGLKQWRSDQAGIYRTPMISTQDKFEPTFGYIEIRAKMPKQVGHWCAFWMQSPTYGKIIGNPAKSGCEIDIMEYRRCLPDKIVHNYHWDGYGPKHKCKGSGKRSFPGLSKGWHTFGLLWTERHYIFYVDRKLSWRSYPAISKRSQYIILSQEVGWPKVRWAGDPARATLPDSMIVDYVRVYQKTKTAERGDRSQRPVQVKGGARLTTASGTAGVSGRIQGNDASAFGGNAWPVKNSGGVNAWTRKGYVRFDISGIKKPVRNAALQLTVAAGGGLDLDVRVYAITDESLDRWDPGATKWKNAPANDAASPSAADLSKSVEVGSIRLDNGDKAHPAGTVVTLSSQALKKVINEDTNGLVTFILGEANAMDKNLSFAGDKHATYAPPTLVYDFSVGQ